MRTVPLGWRLFWRLARGTSPGQPRGILRVWPLWERLARRIWPTMPIPGAPHGLVSLHFRPYRGDPFELPDGTRIQRGDLVGELHMNNHAVLETALKSRWLVLRLAAEDLRALAAWVAQPGPAHALQAIYAVTLIGRTTLPLGFVLRPRPAGLRNRLDRFFLTGLLALYSGEGLDRLAHGLAPHSDPEEIWMSRAELMRRYAKPSE